MFSSPFSASFRFRGCELSSDHVSLRHLVHALLRTTLLRFLAFIFVFRSRGPCPRPIALPGPFLSPFFLLCFLLLSLSFPSPLSLPSVLASLWAVLLLAGLPPSFFAPAAARLVLACSRPLSQLVGVSARGHPLSAFPWPAVRLHRRSFPLMSEGFARGLLPLTAPHLTPYLPLGFPLPPRCASASLRRATPPPALFFYSRRARFLQLLRCDCRNRPPLVLALPSPHVTSRRSPPIFPAIFHAPTTWLRFLVTLASY